MARHDKHAGNPLYPNLPSVAKHRLLNDQTPEGKKAYGQAVHAAIRALQRRELMTAAYGAANLPRDARDVGAMSNSAFMSSLRNAATKLRNVPSKVTSEADYYRAMLESRGIDAGKLETIWFDKNHRNRGLLALWLKAAWNVIKTKRGTPYLVEAKAKPAPAPKSSTPWIKAKPAPAPIAEPVYITGDGKRHLNMSQALRHANKVHRQTGAIVAVKDTPKKRGRPPGSKNRPKPVYSPGQQAAA